MKSFNEWINEQGVHSTSEGSPAPQDFVPTVNVGEDAWLMDKQLRRLASKGYVGKMVTVQYGRNGGKRTGKLVEEPYSDGPGIGYRLD